MGHTHGTQWTEQKIKAAVLEVVEKLELDRMPSKSEMEEYYGDAALTNKLAKGGGLYHYANIYGLPIKQSETQFGLKYERMVRDILIVQGHDAEITSTKCPYDILVNKRVKVDVKVGRIVRSAPSPYYTFGLAKTVQTCDIYVAVTLDKNDSVHKIYIIPASVMSGKSQLSIGMKTSRYDKYVDRWDYIETVDKVFEEIEIA